MNLSNPTNLLIAGVYYVLVITLSFFSIFGVYTLVRYGKSTPLAFSIAIIYAFFFLKILAESYQTLSSLLP
jgi:hypothetical protein